jgi:hypothetical protein
MDRLWNSRSAKEGAKVPEMSSSMPLRDRDLTTNPLFLTAEASRDLLTFPDVIDALRTAYPNLSSLGVVLAIFVEAG